MLKELDFTKPTREARYDPEIARTCFESVGDAIYRAKDEPFFTENKPGGNMYLLLEGEVRLCRPERVLDIVRSGEIFGEISAITRNPRTASAIAISPCKALQLDPKQFKKALRDTPEFALMLMSTMINRIRVTSALLVRTGKLAKRLAEAEGRVFSQNVIQEIIATLGNPTPTRISARTIITREIDSARSMYLVLSGRVALSVNEVIIDNVGPGGMIGEIALVDGANRSITTLAESDVTLLPVNRDDFLMMVKSNPHFAVTMLQSVANHLTQMTATCA
ncbi:MAG: cyclic nucleotide-binding domain-containing protein [Betaproteobacteria bacterium]|jgi:CRP-like cAMP-binding protein|nr:MAG: cyclic nucleotide-binding domain-containing protein [Betaproteobacteria bacterium]